MKMLMKTGSLLLMGLALTGGSLLPTANAKTKKAKVLSTTKIAKAAYHGKHGNVYSSAKLTKVRYRMAKYKHTTWYGTKHALVKKNGKKVSLTYIKAGSKKGWIYSKYLNVGRVSVKKDKAKTPLRKGKTGSRAKRFANDLSTIKRIAISGSSMLQDQINGVSTDPGNGYSSLAENIRGFANEYYLDDYDVAKNDKSALLSIYDLLKKRLPGTSTQKANLESMAKKVSDSEDEGTENDSTRVKTFTSLFTDLITKM